MLAELTGHTELLEPELQLLESADHVQGTGPVIAPPRALAKANAFEI